MAIVTTNKLSIIAPPSAFADIGQFLANALADHLSGAWFFNKFAGETDEQAAKRCSWNWAPGASNEDADRQWPGGYPEFFDSFALFPNTKPHVTRLPDWEPAGGCFLSLACTTDTSIGATGNDRGFICGTYGNAANGGFGCEFSSWATGQARLIDFAAAAPSTAVTNTIVTGAGDLAKWRILFGRSGSSLKLQNMQGDGTTPDPTQSALSGGRRKGSQRWTNGGRLTSGTNYNANTKKISFVLRFNDVADSIELAALTEQALVIADVAGIVPLSTSP